jgi:transcriptional regulator GlxA family with amidase domain
MSDLSIMDLNASGPSRQRGPINSGNERFRRGFKFLKNHCYKSIGVEDLVKVSKLSRRGLHKVFKTNIGQSPGRILRQMRIEHAKDLLIHSNHQLEVIAKMCGYRSNNSFWVSFRNAVGKSPGKFRSQFHAGLRRNGNEPNHLPLAGLPSRSVSGVKRKRRNLTF